MSINYQNFQYIFKDDIQTVHVIRYSQLNNHNLTLLISKASEAIKPKDPNNLVGDGSTIDGIIQSQSGIRFIINAGFNHYRKNFYSWKSQSFNVGDPVGFVKIRDAVYEDYIDINHYGFLTQKNKGDNWYIQDLTALDKDSKYILGCTPLLIFNKTAVLMPINEMTPLKEGEINPPSFLGHGLQIHPRTAVGMIDQDLVFILVENKPDGSGGCSLPELQEIGLMLQLDSMLNLDGGGSSQFRLFLDNEQVISNYVLPEDSNRVLGHSLIVFDERLK